MPKAWSEREKEIIQQTLIDEGRKLFESYGLQKTTVDDIVRAARISKGAFYLFYASKEELYFDILEAMETEFREKIFADVFSPDRSNRESFKLFLRRFFNLIVATPLYERLTTTDYEYLIRKLPPEKLEKHASSDISDISGWFKDWIKQGYVRSVDLNALSGVFLSLFFFVIHRNDIKAADFEATKELWIDILASYLVEK